MPQKPAIPRVLSETKITFADGHRLPTNPSPSTLYYWHTQGVKAAGEDRRVYLEAVKVGGVYYTSIEAYARFIAAQNGTSTD